MSVTLESIAKMSNVSVATVSRVLKNKTNVSVKKRDSVLMAAEALGYPLPATSEHRIAAVVRGDTNLVSPDGQGFESVVARAIARYLKNVGYGLDILTLRAAVSTDIDGYLILGGAHEPDLLERLEGAKSPVVMVGAPSSPDVNCVTADYARGVRDAVAHLAAGGRRKLGLVNGSDVTPTSEEKRWSFAASLLEQDLTFAAGAVSIAEGFDMEAGYRATQTLLRRVPDVEGILFASDHYAVGGLRALREQGKRVPEDVAVVGFHDFPIAEFAEPALSSVRIDMKRLGEIAARRLLDLLNNPDPNRLRIVCPVELVVRASSAAKPGSKA